MNVVDMASKSSKRGLTFDSEERESYSEKLLAVDGLTPYEIPKHRWSEDKDLLPDHADVQT